MSNKIELLVTQVKSELVNNILPFWINNMVDDVNGGFIGAIDSFGVVKTLANKGAVLNSTILWTFSSAYRVLNDSVYLEIATRAKDYLL